jgi:HK97 family phage portal protein
MDNPLTWLWGFLTKSIVTSTTPATSNTSGGPLLDFVDAYRRQREPTHSELLIQLKSTAWTCASINASVCASHAPRLYVLTDTAQARPRCLTRPAPGVTAKAIRDLTRKAASVQVEEVIEHPLITLLDRVNPTMNGFELLELTTLYQEVFGIAYWYLERDSLLGTPREIWPLPTQHIRTEGDHLVYQPAATGVEAKRLDPENLIVFLYPDPRDPYRRGLSPLRAAYEQAAMLSEYAAFKTSRIKNFAIPDALLSPEEVISEDERDRLEKLWNQRMRRGGAGRVIVADQKMKLDLLQHSLGDLAALADMKATKEDVANAFGLPMPFLSGNTNLANLQASQTMHAMLAVRPRIRRRDEKLNEQLVPLLDPSGRLYLWTDDPVPEDKQFALQQRNAGVQLGYLTPNEARAEMGYPPLADGDRLRPTHVPAAPRIPVDSGTVPTRDQDDDGLTGEKTP